MLIYKICALLILFLLFIKALGILILQYYDNKRLIVNYLQIYKSRYFFYTFIFRLVLLVTSLIFGFKYSIIPSILLEITYLLFYKTHKLKLTRRSITISIFGGVILGSFLFLPPIFLFNFLIFSPVFITIYLVMINYLEYPLEFLIRRYYVFKAKRKLKSNSQVKIIAITGSYGKTSLKKYLQQMLEKKYKVLSSPESINTLMGLTKFINENFNDYYEILILEVGVDAKKGMDKILKLFTPDIAILTAIGSMHLATFKSIDNIFNEKIKLLFAASIGYFSFDNWYLKNQANILKKYQKCSKNEYFKNDRREDNGIKVTIFDEEEILIPIFGLFNLSTLAIVIKIAMHFQFEEEEIKNILKAIKGEKHRLEKRYKDNMIILDDSYNGNYEGILEGIATLLSFKGIKAVITPGVIELGKEYRKVNYKIGQQMSKIDYIFIVGDSLDHPLIKGYKDTTLKENIFLVKDFISGYNIIKTLNIDVLLIANDTHRTFIK